MKDLKPKNIITIGASAGGLAAISQLLSSIDTAIDAALFIVIHLGRSSKEENILAFLNKTSKLAVRVPSNGEVIETGIVYLAPVDKHMMIEKHHIVVAKGPLDNYWRPSIDVLFRTAAAAYDSCVTGIILTGLLDDGTSGMVAIKESGGICMVQEPQEAEFADMPNSVINNLEVDYRVPIVDMGYILSELFSRDECEVANVPENIKLEAEITLRMSSSYDQTSELGNPTPFTCPDCGGILTKIEEKKNDRYRCFTGHVFTERVLQEKQVQKTEETLWVAIRMMEERRNFILGMEKTFALNEQLLASRKAKADDLKTHIDHLKDMLKQIPKP